MGATDQVPHRETAVPVTLLTRCGRTLHWEEETYSTFLAAHRQLVERKIIDDSTSRINEDDDWDIAILSPPALVDLLCSMVSAHVRVKRYMQACSAGLYGSLNKNTYSKTASGSTSAAATDATASYEQSKAAALCARYGGANVAYDAALYRDAVNRGTPLEAVVFPVRNAHGEELFYKIKRTSPVRKVFDNYALRVLKKEGAALRRNASTTTRSDAAGGFVFYFRGQLLLGDESANSLGLRDDDRIDVVNEGDDAPSAIAAYTSDEEPIQPLQVKTRRGTSPQPRAQPPQEASLTLQIKPADGSSDTLFFKVKQTIRMERVFIAYAERKGFEVANLLFTCRGNLLHESDTPLDYNMSDQDQIEVVVGESIVVEAKKLAFRL